DYYCQSYDSSTYMVF
nr:immunoglobulin light chain junction region [Macaca mulatta]MOW68198.1 immunoglobulin light chain junction region [Macaca mulatta]MOW68572.1 immunoglobulin light chain junction region [Macaca mulatta]MOW68838.1 immunoglobulin light chain junction region [Macaca mulatta]MOW70261.1 immunoglobulin light chain junction region [Macaca mulatta]